MSTQVTKLPLGDILVDDDFNCREFITPHSVKELAESIKEKGLIQPVVVRRTPNGELRLVAGFRRHKACTYAKLPTIDAIIRDDLTELDAATINLTENIERKNLTLVEEAKAVNKLLMQGYSPQDVGQKLSKSATWIQTRISILELPPAIQEDVASGLLNLKQVQYILNLPEDMQYAAVRKIKEKKIHADNSNDIIKGLLKNDPTRRVSRTSKGIVRGQLEIQRVREYIYELFGPSLEVVLLSWAEGLTTFDMVEVEIKDQCKLFEIPYESIEDKYAVHNALPRTRN